MNAISASAALPPQASFDPDSFCGLCAYPVEPWMRRCPECGRPVIAVPPSTPRADRIAEHIVSFTFAAYALIYAGVVLGL